MSSTNRTNAKQRSKSDYYVTPVDAIGDFLSEFKKDFPRFQPSDILDPCAGGDPVHPVMSYPETLQLHSGWPEFCLTTLDIREDSQAQFKTDFLTWNYPTKYDLIISNPPFVLAREFVDKSLTMVEEGGFVVMLLRLNFFGSQSRKEWWQKQMPVASYIHSKRMTFTDDSQTDSIEYMHAVWIKGEHPTSTSVKII